MSTLDFRLIIGYFNSRDYIVERIEPVNQSELIQARLTIKPLGVFIYCPVVNVVNIDFDRRAVTVQFAYDTLNTYIQRNRLYEISTKTY